MISVIICSANKSLLKQISENIAATIGVPHEIIAADNSVAAQGICAVYNQGILKAQYDTLCFMHEDILIKTEKWGQKVISLFHQDPQLGLIGVAGSAYKPLTPSGWSGLGINTSYLNIIQSFKHTNNKSALVYRNPNNDNLLQVASLDGVWLCTTKKVVQEFIFDETTFKGFHGYDVDFSLSVGQKYKVAVSFEILLEHLSEGVFDKTYLGENLKLYNKWSWHLPVNVEKLSSKQIIYIEKTTFKDFIDKIVEFNYPLIICVKVLYKNKSFFKLDPKLFLKLNYYTLKKYLTAKKVKYGSHNS
ncbi:glycosyltransferase [Mucilaginibacter sp. SP1R1]|uniref:glycosyltransferase n=1 Tax=Mucilaginibacter sp. SP1R1 TaxID=2723091 RepID=UPI0017DDE7E9|nr:glycosyltransferase [Mucilaginibacter sp. SP1R1]MBB6151538.1 glycosyltransferase involved in cell wall biosynthesis [Mucilaginibacter sp. SP1R1]